MKLGFLTACLPKNSLEEICAWASGAHFESLELAAWPVKSTRDYQARQIDAARFTKGDAARVSDLLGGHNLVVSAMAYYDNNIDKNPARKKARIAHLKNLIRAAELLGVPLVGTFVGGRSDLTPDENMKEIGKTFRPLVKFASDHGVKLMIENCPMDHWQKFGLPGNYAWSPELWEALFNEVPSDNFGLNFDPSHLYWLGIDYLRAAKDFAPKIFHAHAKDAEILPEGKYRYGHTGRQIKPVPWKSGWWRYRIPGLGAIDWKALVGTLRAAGYDNVLSIEHEDPVWEGTEEKVKEGLVLGYNHLSPLVRGGA